MTKRLFFLGLIAAVFPVLVALAHMDGSAPAEKHRVYVAFGFHVNLYHSFRNDTNDDRGFGKDIRIIRHTLETLDEFNRKGIPVKGIWDMDNLFSLQEILPRHAPDIIEHIRRRVRENGDEVILMSYNNGLVSAMTPHELDCAVKWSISNPWKSGVRDLFGTFTPIVRPQEMMTTPGNFSVYEKYGIKAVSLYYSETPFDAFRVFSRKLTREEAHNPVLYHNPQTGEKMVVIPTYHPGDLLEHVSLKQWAGELHDLQKNGTLDHDALIYINFDADSEFWEGVEVPRALEWLSNTGGLRQLVDSVKDLPYVRFTSLGDYTDSHGPVGEFSFSQDTADGSFNGYNSWAEKADSSRYWTAIQRNRRACSAGKQAGLIFKNKALAGNLENLIGFSILSRLKALSTTNFGMATPYLARQREQVVVNLMENLDLYSGQIEHQIREGLQKELKGNPFPRESFAGLVPLDTVMVLSGEGDENRFIHVPKPDGYSENMVLVFADRVGKRFPAINLGISGGTTPSPDLFLYMKEKGGLPAGVYLLCRDESMKKDVARDLTIHEKTLSNGRISIRFEHGGLDGVFLDGERMADPGSLVPHVTWKGQVYKGSGVMIPGIRTEDGGSLSCDLQGVIHGPEGKTLKNGGMQYRYTLIEGLPYVMVRGHVLYPATRKTDTFKTGLPGLMRFYDASWSEAAPVEIRFTPKGSEDNPVQVLKRNYLNVATQYPLDYFRHDKRNLRLDNVNNHITESYVGVVAGNRGMAVAMDSMVRSNFAFSPLKMAYGENGAFSISANPFGTYSGRQYRPFTWGNGNGYDATLATGEQFAGAGPTYNGKAVDFSLLVAFFKGDTMPDDIKKNMEDYANPPLVVSASRSMVSPVSGNRYSEAFKRGLDGPGQDPVQSSLAPTARSSKMSPGIPVILGIKVLWANLYALLTS